MQSLKIKVRGESLLSGIWYEAPFTQLHTITPWSQDLFIHKPSQLPGEHTGRLPFPAHGTIQHTRLHCSTRYQLTPGLRECRCGRSTLPRSTSEHNSAQPAIEPAISRLSAAHATMQLWQPTPLKINNAFTKWNQHRMQPGPDECDHNKKQRTRSTW